MQHLHEAGDPPLETARVAGPAKAFNLAAQDSPVSDLSYAEAVRRLEEGMTDLPARAEEAKDKEAALLAGDPSVDSFTVELDNELEVDPEELADDPTLLADVPMPQSVPLDAPVVASDGYFDLVDKEPNISDGLKQMLKQAYA